jgi:glycosyltransferase involved in cell wall biosynthesis
MTASQPAAGPDQPGRPAVEALRYVVADGLHGVVNLHSQATPNDIEWTNPVPSQPIGSFSFKLSIIILTHNDEATIVQAIDEVLNVDYPCAIELIAVDDASTDGTWYLLSSAGAGRVTMHRHEMHQGKGAALRTAVSLATGSYVIPFDADRQYSAADIPRVLAPVLAGRCSVVYGTRLFGCNTVYQSYWHALGNRMLTRLANLLFGSYLSDLHTCFKLMPSALLRELPIGPQGRGLDTELTALLLKRGIRPFEVPVSYYSRSVAQGKKITWRDGMACLRVLLRIRVQREASGMRSRQRNDAPPREDVVARSDQSTLPEAG